MNVHSAFVSAQIAASIGEASAGDSLPVWQGFLPQFQRNLPAPAMDAAWGARLTITGGIATWTLDNFPTVERNGQTILAQDGQVLTLVQLSLVVVRVGKVDTASPAVGEVTVTITDIMGSSVRTFTALENGELILTASKPFILLPTSSVEIAFSPDAENLCADLLLAGAATELAES